MMTCPEFRHVMRWAAALACLLVGLPSGASLASDLSPQDRQELATAGSSLAKKYCYDCHGLRFNGSSRFRVMDPHSLQQEEYVVIGDAEASPMWQRISDGEMPPEDFAQPTDGEKALLKQWIALGAPQPARSEKRTFLSRAHVLASIVADLQTADPSHRQYYRYFDISHLSNNPSYSHADLRTYRAAISKLMNSLSWEAEIVVPHLVSVADVDLQGSLLRVDMRDLGWTARQWTELLAAYPYGLGLHPSSDRRMRDFMEQVAHWSHADLNVIRGDWFVSRASRPPLYDLFLDLPDNVAALEKRLGVDFHRNFRENRIKRAGFTASGVSRGNRMVERHPSLFGYYWKSYDFKDGGERTNLFRFPLGPRFQNHPAPSHAFEQDGGEVVFSLPNGLQGYMLMNGKNEKIDVGPIDVVRDTKEISGSPEIVNGLSCIHCHVQGIIRFRDGVRHGHALAGDLRVKVEDLHPTDEAMAVVVRTDLARFQRALEKAIGGLVQIDENERVPIEQFEEPIGKVAVRFQQDVAVDVAAYELGLETPEALRRAATSDRELVRLGLRSFAEGGTVKRADWEDLSGFTSVFQETARILELGTPAVFQSSKN